ncbi:MAG: biotin-dependent carboxyltransferase family protein [Thermoflexales bacterium]|nr:biotin-dependent carboxyltransferase family protein [Thermoflexales bacterium]
MALEVLDGGWLTTVQDLGRPGYERYGIPLSGAMDFLALRVANCLVGNPPGAAGLEITLAGPTLAATEPCLVAVTGADLAFQVDGREMPMWMSVFVRRGSVISFGGRRRGCRAYLAVAGGIEVPPVLGSRSTYLPGRFGGLDGRALRPGDRLPIGPVSGHLPERAGRKPPPHLIPAWDDCPTVRAVPGPQDDHFPPEGLETFFGSEYRVLPISDRMGYRLEGPPVASRRAEVISDGVPPGAVQVPPDGQPLVMMADHQTTGGYPKIAVVIMADLPRLAQCVPGESRVRFRAVSVTEAQYAYREMMGALEQWERTRAE